MFLIISIKIQDYTDRPHTVTNKKQLLIMEFLLAVKLMMTVLHGV